MRGGEGKEGVDMMYGIITIKKPVEEVKVVELPPQVYNTLRSFVESSSKEEYEWNKGYKLGSKVMFIKRGKWVLTISEITEEELSKLSENMRIVVVSLNNIVKIEIDRNKSCYIVINSNKEYTEEDKYRIAFISSLIIYARPILLNEILEKIKEFISFNNK